MSKQYKSKTCAYCGQERSSQTPDHVLARKLVAEAFRGEIPIVPACEACNREKAILEHYAASVIPYGGRHADSAARLNDDLPKRLAKNQKLHRELAQGHTRVLSREAGLLVPTMAIPLDGKRIEQLVGMMALGLMFHHWGVTPGSSGFVEPMSLTPTGEDQYNTILAGKAMQRAEGNIAQGAMVYRGAQTLDSPLASIWVITLYGGLKVISGANDGTTSTKFGVMTGPPGMDENIVRAISSTLIVRP